LLRLVLSVELLQTFWWWS